MVKTPTVKEHFKMAPTKGDEDLLTFPHTEMRSEPADDTEEKPRGFEKHGDFLDIPTFLRKPARRPVAGGDDETDTTTADSQPEMNGSLRSAKEHERTHIDPEEIQRRLAGLRAIEKDANGEQAFCRQCFQPARLFQVGRCVYAKPCGHRQYQGKLF
jgi:hypothetical protein